MAEQPGAAGHEHSAAQKLGADAEFGQRGSAHAGSVQRKSSAKDFVVDAADGSNKGEVGPYWRSSRAIG
jgi:hypothetical protein